MLCCRRRSLTRRPLNQGVVKTHKPDGESDDFPEARCRPDNGRPGWARRQKPLEEARIRSPFGVASLSSETIAELRPSSLVARETFPNLEAFVAEEDRAFWCYINPKERPSFTLQLLMDLARMQHLIARLFATGAQIGERPFDFFVLGSKLPGVFNLGGDLVLFKEKSSKAT